MLCKLTLAVIRPGDFDARSEQSKFTEKQKNTYRPFHQVMETRGVPADIDAGFIVHKVSKQAPQSKDYFLLESRFWPYSLR